MDLYTNPMTSRMEELAKMNFTAPTGFHQAVGMMPQNSRSVEGQQMRPLQHQGVPTPQQQPSFHPPIMKQPPSHGALKGKGAATENAFGTPRGFEGAAPPLPWDVLGIPRNTLDEKVIQSAYRKYAAIHHPDRNGNAKAFHAVNVAYNELMDKVKHSKESSIGEMKKQATRDLASLGIAEGPANNKAAPLGHGAGFNMAQFNSLFAEHRLWNPEQDGYGEHMVSDDYSSGAMGGVGGGNGNGGGAKMTPQQMLAAREQALRVPLSTNDNSSLRQNFNPQNFNEHFSRFAAEGVSRHPHGAQPSTSLVRRVEPEYIELSGGKGSSLSVEKISDFSSPFAAGSGNGGGGYTDYLKAYSVDALITPHVSDSDVKMYGSVKDLEQERANISFVPDPELVDAWANQEAYEKEKEEQRQQNFLKYQESGYSAFLRLKNVLSDK
jgi:curved DNA-binding protein CbpA